MQQRLASTENLLAILISDSDFMLEMKNKGVDFLERKFTDYACNGGLDQSYFIWNQQMLMQKTLVILLLLQNLKRQL